MSSLKLILACLSKYSMPAPYLLSEKTNTELQKLIINANRGVIGQGGLPQQANRPNQQFLFIETGTTVHAHQTYQNAFLVRFDVSSGVYVLLSQCWAIECNFRRLNHFEFYRGMQVGAIGNVPVFMVESCCAAHGGSPSDSGSGLDVVVGVPCCPGLADTLPFSFFTSNDLFVGTHITGDLTYLSEAGFWHFSQAYAIGVGFTLTINMECDFHTETMLITSQMTWGSALSDFATYTTVAPVDCDDFCFIGSATPLINAGADLSVPADYTSHLAIGACVGDSGSGSGSGSGENLCCDAPSCLSFTVSQASACPCLATPATCTLTGSGGYWTGTLDTPHCFATNWNVQILCVAGQWNFGIGSVGGTLNMDSCSPFQLSRTDYGGSSLLNALCGGDGHINIIVVEGDCGDSGSGGGCADATLKDANDQFSVTIDDGGASQWFKIVTPNFPYSVRITWVTGDHPDVKVYVGDDCNTLVDTLSYGDSGGCFDESALTGAYVWLEVTTPTNMLSTTVINLELNTDPCA
jgi:hypothetical protein